MNIPQYQPAIVLDNSSLQTSVRHLTLGVSESLGFIPGQFFLLRLKGLDGEFVERSYSAANFNDGKTLEFIIRIESKGKMSGLINQLKPNDIIDIKGPFGRFGFQSLPNDFKKLVLIAGGVGIAPFRSMLKKILNDMVKNPIQLFYGFRTPEDFLFQSELEAMKRDLPLSFTTAISEESDSGSWTGHRGYIADFLSPTIFPPDHHTYALLCGPPPMVKAAREKLSALGYAKTHVHLEAW